MPSAADFTMEWQEKSSMGDNWGAQRDRSSKGSLHRQGWKQRQVASLGQPHLPACTQAQGEDEAPSQKPSPHDSYENTRKMRYSSVKRPSALLSVFLLSALQLTIPSTVGTPEQTAWTGDEKLSQTKGCILQLRSRSHVERDARSHWHDRKLRRTEYEVADSSECQSQPSGLTSLYAGEEILFESEVIGVDISPPDSSPIQAAHLLSTTANNKGKQPSSFRATKSGEYAVFVTLRSQPTRHFQIVLVVTSAAAFPASSKACFLAEASDQISSNASASEAAGCTLLSQNDRLSLSLSAGQLRLIPFVISNNATNSTNVTNITTTAVTTTPVPSQNMSTPEPTPGPVDVCSDRNCVSLQVLRYDAWGNRVLSSKSADTVSLELEGVQTSMTELVLNGQRTISSDGAYSKFETFKAKDGEVFLGNISCSSFVCNATHLVTPEQSILSWLVVRMNGVRLSLGSPFLVETPPPPLFSFRVDEESLLGSVEFAGGFTLRVFPADRGGSPIDDSWFGVSCGSDQECRNMAMVEASKFVVVSSFCIQESMKTYPEIEIDFSSIVFEPECAGEPFCGRSIDGGDDLGSNNLDNIRANNTDHLWTNWTNNTNKQFSTTPPPGNVSISSSQRRLGIDDENTKCVENCTWNRKSLIAKINTRIAGHCWLLVKYGEEELFTPQPSLFNGTVLRPGLFALRILAGLPNETTSDVKELKEGGKPYSSVNTTVNPTLSFEIALELRDREGNPVVNPNSSVIAKFRNERIDQNLPAPVFDPSFGAFRVGGAVTVSGTYQLQLFLAPFAVPLKKSPYYVHVAPGNPVAAKSILLSTPETVIIGQFGQFFFQARDVYENFAPSSDPFFDAENIDAVDDNNNAPGYWIWAVPQNIFENGEPVEPQVDVSGTAILKCPGACNGEDPGFKSFKAAFRPTHFGEYYVEVQFCDPLANEGGIQCNKEPYAYNLALLQPPVAPNPCTNEVAGEPGGARVGYACTIPGMNFVTSVIPDRIVIPTSEVVLPAMVRVGRHSNITIRAKDRFRRDSAQASTRCNYTIEYSSIASGMCTFQPETRDFSIDFYPPFAGKYALTVWLNGQVLNNMPKLFSVTTDYREFGGNFSTATGRGLEEAAVGRLNDIILHLRDSYGSQIEPVIYTPARGFPFLRDCGFPFPQLPDGTVTSGYGLSGANTFGLDHGCRLAFHVYVVDAEDRILRPAHGFKVDSLTPIADGAIRVRYRLDEAGPMLMYLRYLPTDDAGYALHDPAGRLSLQSSSTSREGQIHGSPFRVQVAPDIASAEFSRVQGPGILGSVLQDGLWGRFEVVSRDEYGNRMPCRSDEIEVSMRDPDGATMTGVVVEDGDQESFIYDCRVWYYPTLVGRHTVDVKFRGLAAVGGPFYPQVTSGPLESISYSKSFAHMLTSTTFLQCYEDYGPASSVQCRPRARAGERILLRISTRDVRGMIPEDSSTSFSVQVQHQGMLLDDYFSTERTTPGEHEVSLLMTVSGRYEVSVPLDAGFLRFHPHSTISESLFVSPGETSPAACELQGFGLSISTAGTLSQFRIILRDKYGNLQSAPPSPDHTVEEPGKGVFQVSVLGQGHRNTIASVKQQSDGSLTASWVLTVSGQYHLSVSMLDRAPAPLVSQLAVSRHARVEDQSDRFSTLSAARVLEGVLVSSQPQPFLVSVRPGQHCSVGGCGNQYCSSGSAMRITGLHSGNAVAGESFQVELTARDSCGNIASGDGATVVSTIFGPLTRTVSLSDPLISEILSQEESFERQKILQTSSWSADILLTRSGRYAFAVSVDGARVSEGLQLLEVRPSKVFPNHTVLLSAADDMVFSRDKVTFSLQLRDAYGNAVGPENEVIQAYLFLGQSFSGQSFHGLQVQTQGDQYNVAITNISSYGDHVLQVLVNAEDIDGSPFHVKLTGGDMSSYTTFVSSRGATPIPQTSPDGEQSVKFQPTDEIELLVHGRDEIGAETRKGLAQINIQAFHETLGSINAALDDLVVFRSQGPRCTKSNFGNFCEDPPIASRTGNYSRSVLLELIEDGLDHLEVFFGTVAYSKCRSLSGFDDQETVFDNTVEFRRDENVTEGNFTYIRTVIEYHATYFVNFTHCRFLCVAHGCTCATHINGTGTPRDGTCILLNSDYFFETVDASDSAVNRTMSIVREKADLTPWYSDNAELPLQYRLRCEAPGRTYLHISVGSTPVQNSPFIFWVTPLVLDINASVLNIFDASQDLVYSAGPGTNYEHTVKNAVTGGDFQLVLVAKDEFENDLMLDPLDNTHRISAKLVHNIRGVVFSRALERSEEGLMAVIRSLKQTGQYDIQLTQGGREFEDIFPVFEVFSAPSVASGQSVTLETVLCNPAACSIRFQVADDEFGNEADLQFAFWKWDADYGTYRKHDAADIVFAQTRQSGASVFSFVIKTAGDFRIQVSFLDGTEIPDSPFSLTVAAGPADPAATSISGPGSRGSIVNNVQSSTFRIEPKDAEGNPKLCTASNFNAYITNTAAQVAAVTVESAASGELFCRAQYLASSVQSHTLTLEQAGSADIESPLTIVAVARQIDVANSQVSCHLRTSEGSVPDVSSRCSDVENDLAAGSTVTLFASLRDQENLLPDTSAGLMGSLGFCETELSLLDACSSPSTVAQFQMQESFPGDFAWNATVTKSGVYFVTVHISNVTTSDPTWVLHVNPGDSAYQTMLFEGSGLDTAVFLEENTFTIADRDVYGNARASKVALQDSEAIKTADPLSVSAMFGTQAVHLLVTPTRRCLGFQCVITGTYMISYWIYPSTNCGGSLGAGSCASQSAAEVDLRISTSVGSVISASIPVLSRSPFVPGESVLIANAGTTFFEKMTVGQIYSLNLIPREGFALQVPPVFGRIVFESEHGRIIPEIMQQNASGYTTSLHLTVSGDYALSVLDGGAHIAGSPFHISVSAGGPVLSKTRLVGHGAYAAFVNTSSRVEVQLYDQFGNIAETSKVASVQGFLSEVGGPRELQAIYLQEQGFMWLTFTFRYPGVYRWSLAVNEEFVDRGIIVAGNLKSSLRSAQLDFLDGSEVIAMTQETDSQKSLASGPGLTQATAGTSAVFSLFARDVLDRPRTMGGDVFIISLSGGVAAPCRLTEEPSAGGARYDQMATCQYTRSGTYELTISLAGMAISGFPVVLTVFPGPVSEKNSFLQQINPVIYFGTVGTLVVSTTAHVEDGAFVRTVGNNTFTLITQDAFGNQIPILESLANKVRVYVIAQHVRLSIGLVMWNAGEEPQGNATMVGPSTSTGVSGELVNASNGTATASPIADTPSFEESEYVPKWIGLDSDGNVEISFLATKAGKYRMHVLVDNIQIRRYISVAEMQAVARGDVISEPSCCVPASFGKQCPGSGSFDRVCGELITLLPDQINVRNTMVTGAQFKQFRAEIDGDGEGHPDYPIFTIRTADQYGNYQTSSNVELMVTLIDINGTVVHQDNASSVQPANPIQNCRVSDLESTRCGVFEYEWASITSSQSGMYMIHVAFNGSAVGPRRSYINIRPRRPEILRSQIFGPGLQVNVGGEGSYFYFRVFDFYGNAWEPDSDEKPVNVDLGTPTAYGLAEDQKLYLDTTAATSRTKLIYHGYGLFQAQYMAWENQTNIRGNFQVLFDDKRLAIPGVGRSFVPLTIGGTYESLAPVPLVPVAAISFATGSALYNHFAGDEVEVTIHALAEYPVQEFPTGYWPAVEDEDGKHFIVEVQGPPGTLLQRFFPGRRSEFRWQFQAMWIPTVSGEYIISVEYDNTPVQGDPSTPATVMPISPWTVHVHPAPVDPRRTTVRGEGSWLSRVGVLSTFLVQTRDIFGNPITGAVYNRFQGDGFVNASLLAATGPSIIADITSLADGTFRAEYVASRSGTYMLTVMVNGISVSDAPKMVEMAGGWPSLNLTKWSFASTGDEGELCFLTNANLSDLERTSAQDQPFRAGQIFSVAIELRDFLNNSMVTAMTSQEMELQVIVDDDTMFPVRTVDSKYASNFPLTQAGTHNLALLISGHHLTGSPWTFVVGPSQLYGPKCIAIGPGLFTSVVEEENMIWVLGYDFYGNSLSMESAEVSFSVATETGQQATTYVVLGHNATLFYVLHIITEYVITITILGVDGRQEAVQGNGTRVAALPSDPPLVSTAVFLKSGGGLSIVFDRFTDMACMYGRPHWKCNELPKDPKKSCCALFDADSCRALGDQQSSVPPRCWWKSPIELAVLFGSGSSLAGRDILRFREVIRNQEGTSRLFEGAIQLQPPTEAVIPTIIFTTHPEIDLCDTVVMDASLSLGGGGRDMSFEWMALESGAGSRILGRQEGLNRLEEEPRNFTEGMTDIFVAATNYFGNIGGGTLAVRTQPEPMLRPTIVSGVFGTIQISRSSSLRLSSLLQNSLCFNFSDVTFQWYEEGGQALPVQAVGANTTHLEVPPYTLSAGKSYRFKVNVTVISEERSMPASGSVTVEVRPGAIHAALIGIADEVPITAPILLDASASVDTDRSDLPFRYQWTCEPVISVLESSFGETAETSPEPCFFDIRGILLQDSALLDLTGLLTDGTYICMECIPGMYKVSVNVSKPAEGRWSVAHVIFRLHNDPTSTTVAGLVPLDKRVVSAFSRFRLKSVDLNSNHGAVQYDWGLANGQDSCCLGMLDLQNATLFPMGIAQDYLIFKPGLLLPGVHYAFQVSIREIETNITSVATLYVDVHDSPTGGSFAVQPSLGTAIDTEFTVMCRDWTDDSENLPLMYEFGYYSDFTNNRPIGLLVQSRITWKFPTTKMNTVVTVFARVHNQFNPGMTVETQISLGTHIPQTVHEGLAASNKIIADDLDAALKLFDVSSVFQHTDIVVSLLNHIPLEDLPSRRSHNTAKSAMISVRTALKERLQTFAFSMPYNRVTVHAMAKSLQDLTHDPYELDIRVWLQIISLCEDLASHDDLIVNHDDAAQAIAETLNNVLEAAQIQSALHPSTAYLRTAEQVLDAARRTLRRLSIAQLSERVPEDENIILQTKHFVTNSRRILFDTTFSSKFASFTHLESQEAVGDDQGSSFRFGSHAIEKATKQYVVRNGPFLFGTRVYPRTVYAEEGYPRSVRNISFIDLESTWFDAVPISQRNFLRTYYLDMQIFRWREQPFFPAERLRTELNWGSLELGRVASFRCSSSWTDCTATANICTPPVVEGSQGPDYIDTSCIHLLNESSVSSWAVDPDAIEDPDGAGSTLEVRFIRAFDLSKIRYQQRKGPKFCKGTAGRTCASSSDTCDCIVGGDRILSLTFDDGTQQFIELNNTYEKQLFDLDPVTTSMVRMEVLSVYSNSKTCNGRETCAWWNPTCMDWCVNGAQLIEFLSKGPDALVYDVALNYMNNYSMAAAVISDLASVEIRQGHRVMQLYQTESPILVDLPEERHEFTRRNDTLVSCRAWDNITGRWSGIGVLHSNNIVHASSSSYPVHLCQAFMVSTFGLVLIENPYETIYETLAVLTKQGLQQNLPSYFLLLGITLTVLFLYILAGLWVVRRWLLAWMKSEMETRVRFNEYLLQQQSGGAPAPLREKDPALPTVAPIYFPILTLLQSKVVAAQDLLRGTLFRLHLRKSFGRWHYLYALYTGRDEIVIFARITCLFSVVLTVLAFSAVLISNNNITTERWYEASLHIIFSVFPLAQIFPAFFRLVSWRHTTFDRFEDTDVYHGPLIEPQVVYGPKGTEKKTRLKDLKKTLGRDVLYASLKEDTIQDGVVAPVSTVSGRAFGDGNAAVSVQSETLDQRISVLPSPSPDATRPAPVGSRYLGDGDAEGSAEDQAAGLPPITTMGSIKYFVRQRRAKQKQAAANKIKANQVTSSAEEETTTTESGSSGDRNGNGTGSDQASSDSGGIEGKVAISPAKTPVMQDLHAEHSTTIPMLGVPLPGTDELQTPREGAELRSRQTTPSTSPQQDFQDAEPAGLAVGNDAGPRPPPKILKPVPPEPPGQPPRLLNHYQERLLLRKRRRRELDNEVPITSSVRRFVFALVVGQGRENWSRGTRQTDEIFFPRQFRWLCYLICLLWAVICMFLLFVYGAAFDLHISLAWLRLSAMSLAIELAISQTLVSFCQALWLCYGKAWFVQRVTRWCLSRTDLLPPMG